jgi:hypothetical protein
MRADPTLPPRVFDDVVATVQRAFGEALRRRAARRKLPEDDIGGLRFCVICAEPLTTDVLLAQAEKLMAPFSDAKLADVRDPIDDLLRRAAGPFNDGLDCCYACADSAPAVALAAI